MALGELRLILYIYGILLETSFKIIMVNRLLIIALLSLIGNRFIKAQETDSQNVSIGKVEIIEDERLNNILTRYNENKEIDIYRIQIHSGSDRKIAKETQEHFETLYPGEKCYLEWEAPIFLVRAGNYRSKLTAQKYLEIFREYFKYALIVKDEISLIEVMSEQVEQ